MIVVLDGIDGCGKTTVAARVAAKVAAEGHPVLAVRDPGGTEIGEHLRGLVKDRRWPMQPLTQMLLFSAARAELAESRIHPFLSAQPQGVVILDRWWFSTFAYQSTQGVDEDLILGIAKATQARPLFGLRLVQGGCFWLDVPPEVAARRMHVREGASEDRFEAEGGAFAQRLRERYAVLHTRGHLTRIDATPEADLVFQDVWRHVREALAARR